MTVTVIPAQNVYKCDACGLELQVSERLRPPFWGNLTVWIPKVDKGQTSYISRHHDLCIECIEKTGITYR